EPLLEFLRALDGVVWAEPAGSLRRGQDLVGDIELIALLDDPARAIDEVLTLPYVTRVLHRSPRRLYFLVDRVQVGLRFPVRERAGGELLYLTGAAAHVAALQELAVERGLRLAAGALFGTDGARLSTPSEDDIYGALGLPTIPPEIRNGDDELAAAAQGA